MKATWMKDRTAAETARRARARKDKARTPDAWRSKVTARDAVIKERDGQIKAGMERIKAVEAERDLLLVRVRELKKINKEVVV